jgi:hypothetical protein
MSAIEIVVYASRECRADVEAIRLVLKDYRVPHREVSVDRDPAALGRILMWTGSRSVPTLVVADPGHDDPFQPPQPIKSWACPRGVDRGSIISLPSRVELVSWLERQGFVHLVPA